MRKNWPKCPLCKSQNVEIIEVWSGHVIIWTPEYNADEGIMVMGDPMHVEGQCMKCNHKWRMRKRVQISMDWFEEE